MTHAINRWYFLAAAVAALSPATISTGSPNRLAASSVRRIQRSEERHRRRPSRREAGPKMPAAGAPKTFHFPQAATKTLPNGLRVFVVTDHSEPAVAARLVILSAGSIKDPAGMPGVAQMTANMLTQGTEKRSAQGYRRGHRFHRRLARRLGGQGLHRPSRSTS